MAKYDIKSVKRFVEENSNCKLLSKEYINWTSKLSLKCECGNTFEASFKEFKGRKDRNYSKRQCNDCGKKVRVEKRTKTQEQFCKEVYKTVKDEYEIAGKYINANTKIKFKHSICGSEFLMFPNDFLRGQRCPNCYGTPLKTIEQYKKDVFKLYKDEYSILGEYKGNKIKIQTKHNKCGHVWNITPNALLRGYGCPKCASSKGEARIREYLVMSGITFIEQYRVSGCKDELPLPFDFAVFKSNKLNALIEYQGEQHYKPMRFRNADKKFEKTMLHDKIKEDYCKENNIKLIKIPYTENDKIEITLSTLL
ncbi:MAG: DUF2726 domain-containing protein [Clostridiaceae bacterium]|nr:DUF2726 domain-containing protein [Clostridiaceae bacterium]